MILIVHYNGSNNTAISGFAVLYRDSYLSFGIFYLWRLAMVAKHYMLSTDAIMRVYKFHRHFEGVYIAGREK